MTKKDYITVEWTVHDGYVSGSRTQTTRIDISDVEDCETEAELISLIDDAIQDDFDQNIAASYGLDAYRDAIAKWKELKGSES